jgi:4-diphosphocytidyl-2-C-methyl-D-erythritol kinase
MAADRSEPAPAKINLTLHVTGRRGDGYHEIDSLVAFADFGDVIALDDRPGLTVSGPFARGLGTGPDNLVCRAAALFPGWTGGLHLTKNLPVAAGIGGGSADAAATLRLLARRLGVTVPAEAQNLGADVPACLGGRAGRMRGRGEVLSAAGLPPAFVVLVNPGVPVPTSAVFAARTPGFGSPMPAALPDLADFPAFCRFLGAMRNDLLAPASSLAPAIPAVLERLRGLASAGASGLSGSGATCWALFARRAEAEAAAARLSRAEPGWWVRAAGLCR